MKRRIILLNQYYAPDEAATAQMLGDLGAALAEEGYEVTAICCDRSYADPARRYRRREVIDGVRVERAASTGFGRARILGRLADYLTFFLGATRRLLFGPRPDVVISLTTPPFIALIGTLCARLRGARSIFWSMDVYPDVAYELGTIRKNSLAGHVVGLLSRWTLRLADVVVALGETMGERLSVAGARRVVVIHNWASENISDSGFRILDLEETGEAEISGSGTRKSTSFREERGWSDAFVVMYSGNVGLAHEFETLLEGAKGISDFGFRVSNLKDSEAGSEPADSQPSPLLNPKFEIRNSKCLFVFIGGGPRFDATRARAARLGLTNVEFHPYVSRDRLGESLAAADLHVVTLRHRMPGLLVPSKIYGILAAGRPTLYVGPREGEVYDILREGKCGSTVDIGDAEGVVAIIKSYTDDPRKGLEEGRRARALFEARFTRERAIRQFSELLEGLQ